MKNYILKNKSLFAFAVLVSLQLFLVIGMGLSFYMNYLSFMNIKKQTGFSSANFSFFDFILNSGEAMDAHNQVSRQIGFQEQQIKTYISNFFGVSSSGSNGVAKASSSEALNYALINNFFSFNTYLQIFVALFAMFFVSVVVNIALFSKLFWNCLITAKKFNFIKLFTCLCLPILGFPLTYKVEQESLKRGELLDEKFWLIENSVFYNTYWKLKNKKNTFSDNSDKENLINVQNLSFSPDTKHSWWRHLVDNYLFIKGKTDVIDEKQHLYTQKKLFGKSKEKKYILKNVNLKIKKGSFNVIIGPNGSGKTTLIKALINLNENISGNILWNGTDISCINKTTFARHISYIPQFININQSITVIDYLLFSRYPYKNLSENTKEKDQIAVLKAIKESNCIDFAHKTLDELSGGQKQKILLASILVQEADTIVLDEPTSFLDIRNQMFFLESLKELNRQGKTIIMILHDLQQSINYADNLIVMKDGTIFKSGNPRDIVNEELLKETFRISCSILKENNSIKIQNIYSLDA